MRLRYVCRCFPEIIYVVSALRFQSVFLECCTYKSALPSRVSPLNCRTYTIRQRNVVGFSSNDVCTDVLLTCDSRVRLHVNDVVCVCRRECACEPPRLGTVCSGGSVRMISEGVSTRMCASASRRPAGVTVTLGARTGGLAGGGAAAATGAGAGTSSAGVWLRFAAGCRPPINLLHTRVGGTPRTNIQDTAVAGEFSISYTFSRQVVMVPAKHTRGCSLQFL